MEPASGPNPGHQLVPVSARRRAGRPQDGREAAERSPRLPHLHGPSSKGQRTARGAQNKSREAADRQLQRRLNAAHTERKQRGRGPAGAQQETPIGQRRKKERRGGVGRAALGRRGETAERPPRRCRARPEARADSTGRAGSSGGPLSGREQRAHLELHLRVHLEQRGHTGRCESGSRRATGRACRHPTAGSAAAGSEVTPRAANSSSLAPRLTAPPGPGSWQEGNRGERGKENGRHRGFHTPARTLPGCASRPAEMMAVVRTRG